jgi:hypothetical protein
MAITPDMTFWINTLVLNKLKDVCSSLDLNGSDRKVYDVCIRDLRNYMVYLQRNYLKIEEDPQNMLTNPFISMAITENGVLYQNLQTTKEVAEFIDMWVKMWWKKWLERTKIIISNDQLPKNSLHIGGGGSPSVTLSPEETDELLGVTIMKLIQFGEICCTQIIAENLLKKAVEDLKGKELPDKLRLISKLQRQAKDISYVHGTLVFIKPDENYFKLREWRDGFTGNRIF